MTAVYKGELKAGELTSDAGRLRMKELFKERLKANK